MAEDATLTLNLKKGILKQLVLDDLDSKVRSIVRQTIKNPTTSGTPQNLVIQVPRSVTPSGFNTSKQPISQVQGHATDIVSNISKASLPLVSSANARVKNPLAPGASSKAEADTALEIPHITSQDGAISGTKPIWN